MLLMDFVGECANPECLDIEVFDIEAGEVVWSGLGSNIPGYLEDQSLESFDAPEGRVLTLNVSGVKPWPAWTFRDGKAHKSPWGSIV